MHHLQNGGKHHTLWNNQWHHKLWLIMPDLTTTLAFLPKFMSAPKILATAIAKVQQVSVGLLGKEVEVERSVALIDAALAGCSFSCRITLYSII